MVGEDEGEKGVTYEKLDCIQMRQQWNRTTQVTQSYNKRCKAGHRGLELEDSLGFNAKGVSEK